MSNYLETCKFGVDWFNIIIDGSDDVVSLINFWSNLNEEMSLENWTVGSCQKGYTRSLHFQGKNFIRVAFNPSEKGEFYANFDNDKLNKGIFISLSGDGCRYLASHGILSHSLLYFKGLGCHCSRMDVYMDIFDRENPLVDTLRSTFKSHLVPNKFFNNTVIKTNMHVKSSNIQFNDVLDPFSNELTTNITFGKHSSSFGMFRCYNKAAEIVDGRLRSSSEQLLEGLDYWYRLEYEVHNGHAQLYFDKLFSYNGDFAVVLPTVYGEIASDMFTLKVIPHIFSRNFSNFKTVDVWQEFLNSIINLTFIQELIDDLVSIPYIKRTDFDSLVSNGNRIKGYFYALLTAFFTSESFRNDILRYGREKFECSPQYTELRSELPLIDIKSLIKEVA